MKIDHDGVARGSFDAFVQIIAALRAEDGCPWDRAQTFQSLKPCMVNEMTEALAGIDLYEASGDADNFCEELGDVLLQVVLLAQIAREEGLFSIEDVVRGISRKMLRRHPHVFGDEKTRAAGAGAQGEGSVCGGGAAGDGAAEGGRGILTDREKPDCYSSLPAAPRGAVIGHRVNHNA